MHCRRLRGICPQGGKRAEGAPCDGLPRHWRQEGRPLLPVHPWNDQLEGVHASLARRELPRPFQLRSTARTWRSGRDSHGQIGLRPRTGEGHAADVIRMERVIC